MIPTNVNILTPIHLSQRTEVSYQRTDCMDTSLFGDCFYSIIVAGISMSMNEGDGEYVMSLLSQDIRKGAMIVMEQGGKGNCRGIDYQI